MISARPAELDDGKAHRVNEEEGSDNPASVGPVEQAEVRLQLERETTRGRCCKSALLDEVVRLAAFVGSHREELKSEAPH